MPHTFTIGRTRVHLLSDGYYVQEAGGFFGLVPRALWQRVVTPDEMNQIPATTRALLVESDGGLILVDTGYGDKHSGKMRSILQLRGSRRIVSDLAAVGYRPEDVDIVLLTHLHNDHIGGATEWDTPDGTPGPLVPVFLNARHIVQRIDLAAASFPNERTRATYHPDNWEPLRERGLLEVVDGPQQVAAGVRTEIAPGHTVAIQVVWVESGGERLLFLGDAANWAVHMERLAWVPAFDIYPMDSIETKRRLRHEALRHDALLIFQHDASVATGRLVEGERGPKVEIERCDTPPQ